MPHPRQGPGRGVQPERPAESAGGTGAPPAPPRSPHPSPSPHSGLECLGVQRERPPTPGSRAPAPWRLLYSTLKGPTRQFQFPTFQRKIKLFLNTGERRISLRASQKRAPPAPHPHPVRPPKRPVRLRNSRFYGRDDAFPSRTASVNGRPRGPLPSAPPARAS